MKYSDETIKALAALRTYAVRYPSMGLSEAVNTLDNEGVFAALDEQTDHASAEDILREAALKEAEELYGKPDPAEYGDLDALDLHPGYVPAMDRLGTLSYPKDNPHSPGCPSIKHRH